jgi:hypothetical protein
MPSTYTTKILAVLYMRKKNGKKEVADRDW